MRIRSGVILERCPYQQRQKKKQKKKEALKKSTAGKQMNLNAPTIAQVLQDEAADDDDEDEDSTPAPSPKSSASPRKVTTSADPPALPDWTPPVPQFKPDGPVSKKKVDGEEKIAQTGTSPLTPATRRCMGDRENRQVQPRAEQP